MLKNVVLPAPFGPDQAHDRALRDREVDVVDRDQAAELLSQSVDLEQELVVLAPRSVRSNVHQRLVVDALLELELPPLLGDQALRPEEHR